MTSKSSTVSSADAQYIKDITSYGDDHVLVAAREIYAPDNTKLLHSGARINSHILERLLERGTAIPLDQCVSAEDAIRHADIVAHGQRLASKSWVMRAILMSLQDAAATYWENIEAVLLPPSVATRLTVMAEKNAREFDHAVHALCASVFLGMAAKLQRPELRKLATAALLHDVGMHHIDDALFAAGKPLTTDARHHLLAHPLIASEIANREPALGDNASSGIAQHHERIDGSGYPHALSGDEINIFGRILMLSEVILSQSSQENPFAIRKLAILLRFNHRAFDRSLAESLHATLSRHGTETGLSIGDVQGKLSDCESVFAMLSEWRGVATGSCPATKFLNERISRLRRWIAETGMSVDDYAAVSHINEDPSIRSEAICIAREAQWHIRQIAYETTDRFRRIDTPGTRSWIEKALQAG